MLHGKYDKITGEWLREIISELTRRSRRYVTSAEYETYWARIAADVAGIQTQCDSILSRLQVLQGYAADLEVRYDA